MHLALFYKEYIRYKIIHVFGKDDKEKRRKVGSDKP